MQECCTAALVAIAQDFQGGSLVFIDDGIADAIAWGAGLDCLAGESATADDARPSPVSASNRP
jgi:hypothetical protein